MVRFRLFAAEKDFSLVGGVSLLRRKRGGKVT